MNVMNDLSPQTREQLGRAEWTKSSYSSGGTNCVEVAALDGDVIAVRDSKQSNGPSLIFPAVQYRVWVEGIKKA
ncbi:DUF397 domain-containing protein [Streptomyces sp. NPDC015350]|uniref:DUF397 domain-containing protein n=1 Tax=Streptomyces sp. NPDC015350 TaxID=3364955 RepID=UPI0036FE2FA7